MKTLFINKSFNYDGTQLRAQYAYREYGLLGPSIVSWIGPCDIPAQNMVDLEDVLASEVIQGSSMLHFIFEHFGEGLLNMVLWQRLFASIVQQLIYEKSKQMLQRQGDDLFLADKKLSISIATVSAVSGLVHFAVNVRAIGTPVPAIGLEDLGVQDAKEFSQEVMEVFRREFSSVFDATCKVRSV